MIRPPPTGPSVSLSETNLLSYLVEVVAKGILRRLKPQIERLQHITE